MPIPWTMEEREFRSPIRTEDPRPLDCKLKLRGRVHRPGPDDYCINCPFFFERSEIEITGDDRRAPREVKGV